MLIQDSTVKMFISMDSLWTKKKVLIEGVGKIVELNRKKSTGGKVYKRKGGRHDAKGESKGWELAEMKH